MATAAVTASDPVSIPLARAFLALGDPALPAPPERPRRRVRMAAAMVASLALALAAPVSAAGLAAADADDRTSGTLPGKTWVAGADEDDGADAGDG
jgi:hypothetical protein